MVSSTQQKTISHGRHMRRCYKENYPNNLIDKLFGIGFSKTFSAPNDLLSTIDFIMTTELTERERDIIQRRYQDRQNLEQIGAEYRLTRERIRQIENRAIQKMQKSVPATIITLGETAFYDQDIHEKYRERQALLTCDIRDYKNTWFGLMSTDVQKLNSHGITTIGDILLCNIQDFHDILPKTSVTHVVCMQQHAISDLTKLNGIIISLERHFGLNEAQTDTYPANIFAAIFGYDITNHIGCTPNRDQIDGLYVLIKQKLNRNQQMLLRYQYQTHMPAQDCKRLWHIQKNSNPHKLRHIIHILREQPDCYAYIPTISHIDINTSANDTLIRTQKYLSGLNIPSQQIQIAYLQSIKLTDINLSSAEIAILQSANMTTVADALMDNNDMIPNDLKDRVRIAVCIYTTTVDSMPITKRAHHTLRRAGINSMEIVMNMSDSDLLSIRNLGADTLRDIRTAITAILESLQ